MSVQMLLLSCTCTGELHGKYIVFSNSCTILHISNDYFSLMDPVTHRLTASSLAKHSNGRCLLLRFRLAPQHAFPAALLDTFVAYLSLLSPPDGAFHDDVPPTRIVLAGDSSGAGLATSLLLLLLTIRRLNITHIRFHGRDVDITGITTAVNGIPSPPVAGLALASPWLDISRCLPSVHANARWDIIAPPSKDFDKPCPDFPHDSIWPAKPPRVETYCKAELVTHPLVSPLAAPTVLWQGAPPVYLSIGWESMQDEAEVFARRVYSAGSAVLFDGYVGMPHCFSMVPWNWQGRQAQKNWGRFCRDAVNGEIQRTHLGTWTRKNRVITKVELGALGMWYDLDDAKVSELLAEQRERRIVLERRMLEEWECRT
jgi:acetyl esterase/lipase